MKPVVKMSSEIRDSNRSEVGRSHRDLGSELGKGQRQPEVRGSERYELGIGQREALVGSRQTPEVGRNQSTRSVDRDPVCSRLVYMSSS